MSKIETVIEEWRARMAEALPQREEALAELEEHLREHLAHLQLQGKSDEEALALALERLGEPHTVAREFNRIPAGWRPGRILLPGLALILVVLLVFSTWNWSRRLPVSGLQMVFLLTYVTGCFGVLGSGLIAMSAFLTTWWRPLRERERRAVRQLLARLARLAGIFIPIGLALGTLWRAQYIPNQWTLWSYQLRLTGVVASVALLIVAQSRPPANDRVRWLSAIFASLVLFSSMSPSIRVADISVAWLCAVFLAGQILLALPRFRIRIERLREPY